MKKILITLAMMFMVPSVVFATNLDLSVDKTQLSTDEVVHVNLTVDGQIDGGQIGVEGIENFEVVGQQSSRSIQMINGKTTQIQSQKITLQPKSVGNFEVRALAQENGQQIQSKTITLNVQKSALDTTKDELLQNTQLTTPQSIPQQDNAINNLDDVIANQEPISDFDTDLLRESQAEESEKTDDTSTVTLQNNPQDLQVNKIEDFPQIEHISEFNMMFWLVSLGIVALVVIIFSSIFIVISNKQKKS
jgi:hypothetical protein